MANVTFWHGSWADAGETGLVPGAEHNWSLVHPSLIYNSVVHVTAGPVNSSYGDQILQVTNVRTEADAAGNRRFFFTIKNVGPVRAIGYAMNFSFISA